VLDRSPIGSSSGSAAAVAANLCVAAVGTETNGSIVSPSSACGIVGFKPTVGLVSRSGVIPIAAAYDTAGPMTRTVRDAALVLAALAGVDERDAATRAIPDGQAGKIGTRLPEGALRGARVGLIRGSGKDDRPYLESARAAALDAIRSAGAEVIDIGEFPGLAAGGPPRIEVMLYEMKAGINAYLAELGPNARMKTLADIIKFNDEHWPQEQPLFGQQHFMRAQAKGPLTDLAYLEARDKAWRVAREEGIDALLEKHRLDALVTMTTGPAGLINQPEGGDPVFGPKGPGGSGGSTPAAMAGYPSVTVPMADISGLPIGFMFYGRAWSEPRLLALAADFEARTHVRREPKFLPTIPVEAKATESSQGSRD
jgi:amidase